MRRTDPGIDIMSLGEWLNTAVGWLLGVTFLVLLINVFLDRASPTKRSSSKPNPPTKREDEHNGR